ncbi:NocE [Streptomyces sp. NPDC089919]|uniref:golvesin C-terminal-like domain-containing protein n=1 Tax=Streptomyces sp. NPDC089919 TaxID=3155188 RepID=UPI003447CE0C
MRPDRRRRSAMAVALASAAIAVPLALPAQAGPLPAVPRPAPGATAQPADTHPAEVPAAARRGVIGSASDRAWTTSGDAAGFHVLVADAGAGYRWKTAATLLEPGFDTDAWIGNACATESGRRVVVAYAPRTFTNKPDLMSRGAFTAVVELATGKVTKLPVQASLSYFSPGCGEGEEAVLSQFTDDGQKENATRLVTVDATAGKAGKPLKLRGQITSAIPYGNGQLVAADGAQLVRIGKDGTRRRIARTDRTPFQITKDASGGIAFLDQARAARPVSAASGAARSGAARTAVPQGEVGYVDAGTVRSAGSGRRPAPRRVATGRLAELDLAGSASGEVFVTGKARTEGRLPAHLHNPGTLRKDARLSLRARAAVSTRWARGKDTPVRPDQATTERTVVTEVRVLSTGRSVELSATPGEAPVSAARLAEGRSLTPALRVAGAVRSPAPKGKGSYSSPNDPVEVERVCAVPRGDVRKQAFQPTPRQVEWAVDQAVIGGLDKWTPREPNWKSTGMAGYHPQSLFPLRALSGDPNGHPDKADEWHIPAQILLGITAQESNMWQATRYAVPGVTANPLIGNYYGIKYAANGTQTDPWAINWSYADCGYGITQITDGMRLPGHEQEALSTTQQEAAALDYAANLAAGADKLAEKWNQTRDAGLVVNNGKPKYIENWFFALWAYNAGFYPQADAAKNAGTWGVGWTNNPANPLWKANRTPFLESANGADDYSHASHPQDWPYQEKVMGWAARPLSAMTKPGSMGPGYRAAWWTNTTERTAGLKPSEAMFCDATNECNPDKISDDAKNEPGLGPCNRADLHCWHHHAVQWKNCDQNLCGNAVHRFDNDNYKEPDDENAYPPRCQPGLPSNALIVDDVPNAVRPAGSDARSCGTITSNGTFRFDFVNDLGQYPGKMDLHQIGAGYGNHFWFSHTRDLNTATGARLNIKGTWTLNQNIPGSGWARVLVHMPDHGAHTRQARYVVDNTDSTSPARVAPQRTRENRWVDIGSFHFTGTPAVSLSTHTPDGTGTEDVAWDAVAFLPLPGKPAHQIVAMGDSFSSGEGASVSGGADYYKETNYRDNTAPATPGVPSTRDACHRSTKAWSRQATVPGMSSSIGALADGYAPSMDYHLIACSGARTYNVLNKADDARFGRSEYGELPQLDLGYLDQNTTLVTISIGGNDTGFTDIFAACYISGNCPYSRVKVVGVDGTKTDQVSDDLRVYVPDRIKNLVHPQIVKTLNAIHLRAPKAQIVLMGYPPMLENHGSCVAMSYVNTDWLNSIGDVLLNEMQAAADEVKAQGVQVRFANPKNRFAGKAICGSPESIHGLVTDLVESDDALVDTDLVKAGSSAQSFHPKIEGARIYADVLQDTLALMGY